MAANMFTPPFLVLFRDSRHRRRVSLSHRERARSPIFTRYGGSILWRGRDIPKH